jgi:hypothetical protein
MFQENIAEKAKNLILQNFEAIERDWLQSRKESDEPEKVKFPVVIKIDLTNKDGSSPNAKVKIEWAVLAKRSFEAEVDNDETPELPL